MPRSRALAATTTLPPPRQPGYRKQDATYWCNCISKCDGIMQIRNRGTYNYHAKYRRAEAEMPGAGETMAATPASQSTGMPLEGSQQGFQTLGGPSEVLMDEESDQEGQMEGWYQDEGDQPWAAWFQEPELGLMDDNNDLGLHPAGLPGSGQGLVDSDDESESSEDSDDDDDSLTQLPSSDSRTSDDDDDNGDSSDENDDDDGDTPEALPIATLQDLKIAMAYIEFIKNARLDNGGLSQKTVDRLLSPPTCLLSVADDPDLELCIGLFVDLTHTSEKAYNKAMRRIQHRFTGSTIYTYEQIKAKIRELTGIVELKNDMCINSCMGYTGPLEHLRRCLICGEPRYHIVKGKEAPRQQYFTIPVGPQVQALLRSVQTAELAQYRKDETKKVLDSCTRISDDGTVKIDVPVYEDYIHGYDYLQAVLRGDIKEDDFVLLFSIDGAQLYELKKSDCWIYIWVPMNLPPWLRFKKKFVMPGGFIPGPNKPKNIDSFLYPGLHHVSALQKEGLGIWDPLRDATYISHLYVIFNTADGPGLCYLHGRNGHLGYMGCRHWCPVPGRRFNGKSNTYYPALLKPFGRLPPGSDHPDVQISTLMDTASDARLVEYNTKLALVIESQDMDEYADNRRDTGISKPSIFSGLPDSGRLSMVAGFPSDLMHLSALNITSVVMDLLRGTMDVAGHDDKDNWPWAVYLDDELWKKHGAIVEGFKRHLQSSVERPPRNPAKKINSGYKAKEYLSYVYGMLPALLWGVLPEPYYGNFCKLVYGIRILTQRRVTKDEIQAAHRALVDFALEFEQIYVQRMPERIHFVRQCIHNLIHLGPETLRVGPLCLLAQWVMERTIGNLGEEIKLHSDPYKNLSKRGLRRAQVNGIISMLNMDPPPAPPRGATEYGDTGHFMLNPTEATASRMTPEAQAAFEEYLLEQDPDADVGGTQGVKCAKRGRIRLPNRQIGRTLWKESLKSADAPLRIARMVVEEVAGEDDEPIKDVRIGEAQYFFEAYIGDKKEGLAMLSLCEDPDPNILRQTNNVLWVTNYRSGQNLYVVPITSITSVVSLLPFPGIPGTWFLFEDMGLDISALGSANFAGDEKVEDGDGDDE